MRRVLVVVAVAVAVVDAEGEERRVFAVGVAIAEAAVGAGVVVAGGVVEDTEPDIAAESNTDSTNRRMNYSPAQGR
ncbi:hypothetical protein R3P38DRAFT_3122187 [Favolaschia claudopus]|uniref:Secreted protein n=1 Tax=Favolaschia claudopus TaxID=2862362 RepID=A0AAV9ZCZ1_9AGAR